MCVAQTTFLLCWICAFTDPYKAKLVRVDKKHVLKQVTNLQSSIINRKTEKYTLYFIHLIFDCNTTQACMTVISLFSQTQ